MRAPENSLHEGHFVSLYILSLSEVSDWFSSGRELLSLSCLWNAHKGNDSHFRPADPNKLTNSKPHVLCALYSSQCAFSCSPSPPFAWLIPHPPTASQSKQGLSSARFPPWSSFNVGLSPRAGDFHQSWGNSVFLKALNYFQLQWKLALVWKVISRRLMKMHKQSHRSAGHRCACAESETPWTLSAGLVTAI